MKKAFTLVEILVVVTIISLLASIAAISYSRFVKQSRDARRKTDIEQIRAAVELYRNFNNAYPATITFGATIADATPSTYMSKVPNDPMSGSTTLGYTYFYASAAPNQDYTLCAYIEGQDPKVTGHSCSTILTLDCNYCMGPYGEL